VVGDREADHGTVSVRSRSEGDLGARPVGELAAELKKTVDQRAIKP
jgi:threonyl-tRNA synthetase